MSAQKKTADCENDFVLSEQPLDMPVSKSSSGIENGGNDLTPRQCEPVRCEHCLRWFNEDVHSRHVAVCVNVIRRPKPPPGKNSTWYSALILLTVFLRFTDDLGIRHGSRGSLCSTATTSATSRTSRIGRPASHRRSSLPPTAIAAHASELLPGDESAGSSLELVRQEWELVCLLLRDKKMALNNVTSLHDQSTSALRWMQKLRVCAQKANVI
jgi:hypothetical protein